MGPRGGEERHGRPVGSGEVGRRRGRRATRALGTTNPNVTMSGASAARERRRKCPRRATWVPNGTIRKCYWCHLGELVHGRRNRGVRPRRYTAPTVRVDQVIPSLASRDAIGVSALNLRNGLRAAGIDSDIYYGSHTPDVAHEGRPVIELGRAGPRPLAAVSSVDREPRLRHPRGTTRAQARELSQHHARSPVARLGAGRGLRGRARTLAAGAPRSPEPLRRRGLGLQRVGARAPWATKGPPSSRC